MCGRFTLTTNDYQAVADALEADYDPEDLESYRPRYNVAPTDPHPIVVSRPAGGGPRRWLELGIWGFVAPWDAGKADPSIHINARAETAATKPLFRGSWIGRRCLVAANGFFEWTGPKHDRQPVWFHRPDDGIITFAGLYLDHTDPRTGEVQRRFTVVTTDPNRLVEPVHDRMPAIIGPERADQWLTPPPDKDDREGSEALRAALAELVTPAPEDLLVATRVSKRVNSVRNDDPACLEPEPEQQGLF